MFFMGITIMFLLFLAVVSVGVFMSKPEETVSRLTFNKPKVNIDIGVFDSDQFKNLQPFTGMETQYSYTAITKSNKTETGFVSAASIDEAKAKLESGGLVVSVIKEVEIGRDNPFVPYYATATPTPSPSKTK